MIKIPILPEEIIEAKEKTKEFDEQKTYDKFECKNNYIGLLGEMVFNRWLNEKNIKHEWVNFIKKDYNTEDFIINDQKVDLKTTFHSKLFIQEPRFDIYILGRLNPDMKELIVISYIELDKLKNLITKGKAEVWSREEYGRTDFVISISQMKPIEEFFGIKEEIEYDY